LECEYEKIATCPAIWSERSSRCCKTLFRNRSLIQTMYNSIRKKEGENLKDLKFTQTQTRCQNLSTIINCWYNRLAVVIGGGGCVLKRWKLGSSLRLLLPPDLRWRMVASFAI
jgi:hypothetical protein